MEKGVSWLHAKKFFNKLDQFEFVKTHKSHYESFLKSYMTPLYLRVLEPKKKSSLIFNNFYISTPILKTWHDHLWAQYRATFVLNSKNH